MTRPRKMQPKIVEVPQAWRNADKCIRLAQHFTDRAGVCAALQDPKQAAACLALARLAARHAAEKYGLAAAALDPEQRECAESAHSPEVGTVTP